MKNFLILPVCILFCIHTVFSQAGSLDATFSSDGKATVLVGKTSSVANAVTMEPFFPVDRILVAGSFYSSSHNSSDFLIVRFNTDGTLDKTFAGTGAKGIDFGGGDEAHSIIVQPDAKIAVFGRSGLNAAAARLKADGTLDSSFGTNGKTVIAWNGEITSAAIQSDGKFILAGGWNTGINSETEFALIRLNSNGTLDNTFGINGEVFTAFQGGRGYDYAESVAIQPDGKIVAGGITVNSVDRDLFAMARYNSDGTLDPTFGSAGKLTTQVGIADAEGYAEAIQPDGKILQAGHCYNSQGKGEFAIVRHKSNGILDSSFSKDGIAGLVFDDEAYANSIALQATGQIILAGSDENSTENANIAIARLNSDGTLDKTFGSSGKVITDFGGDDYGLASTVQPDGKLVVAGLKNDLRLIIARYFTTGTSLTMPDEKNITDIKSANADVLAQNFPNPFSNSTTINYSLPQSGIGGTSAKIIVTDKNGNALKQFSVSQNKGSITVDASTLSSGAYQYSLYVDGKLIATKEMILSK
jgi:uncharacterized delta-60 repeat protein